MAVGASGGVTVGPSVGGWAKGRSQWVAWSAVTIALVVIDVISALGLLFLVLLHSGRGGGLSDMFGGGFGTQAAGSTVIEKNLDRLTIVAALIFAFCTLALALLLDSS